MDNQLVKFEICGLHGVRDYSISIKDNRVIIVGENGSGKTTIFKIMYSTISCDWDSLRSFEFNCVSICFSDSINVTVSKELLDSFYDINDIDRVQNYGDSRYYGRHMRPYGLINNLIALKRAAEEKTREELDAYLSENRPPFRYYKSALDADSAKKLYNITKIIEQHVDATILYLPTYRRIEEQLKTIFPRFDRDDIDKVRSSQRNNRAIELVEFGMDDVELAVRKYQERLNDFSRAQQNKLTLGYLNEIIGEKYEQVDIDKIRKLTETQIDDILKRIEQSILTDEQKGQIMRILSQARDTLEPPTLVREKIICHYFLKLIDFDRKMSEEEAALIKFVDICNKYLVSNKLVYDKQNFSCSILNKISGNYTDSYSIHFQDLSSGEKQIVSIFSHLNLGKAKKVFVFIDEPELSLSVDWQRMILVDIIDSASCTGLVATTHSPFVFDNELESYVHGINEFCVRG